MSSSVFVKFCLMSSVVSNQCPFRTFLSLGNREKSHGARSGEYGGCCCNWAVPCLAKNCCTRCELCAGALSWCRIQSPSRHFSGRFRRTDSRRCCTVICYLSYCQSPVIANDCSNFSNHFLVSQCWRSFWAGVAFNGGSTLFKLTEPVKHLCTTHCICCNNWYVSVAVFPILKRNLMQMHCSVLSPIVKIAVT